MLCVIIYLKSTMMFFTKLFVLPGVTDFSRLCHLLMLLCFPFLSTYLLSINFRFFIQDSNLQDISQETHRIETKVP